MMNKRIQELAEQANKDLDGAIPFGFAEKFAELIVKECADAADMAYDARCEYPGDYVGQQMGYGEDIGIAFWRSK